MKAIYLGVAKALSFAKLLEAKKVSNKNKKGSYAKKFFRGNTK